MSQASFMEKGAKEGVRPGQYGEGPLAKMIEQQTAKLPSDTFFLNFEFPLRMLRAARLAAKLRFDVAPDVLAAIRRMAGDLARITAERIRDEFTKLLCGADPVLSLRLLVDTGLADVRVLAERVAVRFDELLGDDA